MFLFCCCFYFRPDNLLVPTYRPSFLGLIRLLAASLPHLGVLDLDDRNGHPSTQLIPHVSWLLLPLTFHSFVCHILLHTRDLGRITGHCSKISHSCPSVAIRYHPSCAPRCLATRDPYPALPRASSVLLVTRSFRPRRGLTLQRFSARVLSRKLL